MAQQDVAFCIFYGAISIAMLAVAFSYWYNELYKKNK